MLTISVLSQKGGAGKTTLATHLAAAAHLAGRKTTLIDLDPQGSASAWYAERRDGSRLAGLPVMGAFSGGLSRAKFRELARGSEVVVCDGPPRLGEVSRAAAFASDLVVIALRPGGFDLWSTVALRPGEDESRKTMHILDDADAMRELAGRPPVPRIFVLNGASPGRTTKAFTWVASALPGENRRVCPVVIHSRTAFAECVPFGECVMTMFPGSPAAAEIEKLYAHVLDLCTEARTDG